MSSRNAYEMEGLVSNNFMLSQFSNAKLMMIQFRHNQLPLPIRWRSEDLNTSRKSEIKLQILQWNMIDD